MTLRNITLSQYVLPELKHWTPSEFEMKYHFNTPRKLKTLEKVRAKEDAKLLAKYDSEVLTYNEILSRCDTIDRLPKSIANLFQETVSRRIAQVKKIHEDQIKESEAFKAKYDGVKGSPDCPSYRATISAYSARDYVKIYFLSKRSYYGSKMTWEDNAIKEYPALANVNKEEYLADANRFFSLRDADICYCRGCSIEDAITITIRDYVRHLYGIYEEMKAKLGGDPLICECNDGWGIGGHFNGILSRNEKRVSFKSFLAGGYNIQCLHVRFKMTVLK